MMLAGCSLLGACAPRSRLCVASSECAQTSACVAGRCQLQGPAVKPAVDSARRVVVRPIDIAYVKRGDRPTGGGLPADVPLGKDGGKLLLRFSVSVPPGANLVEAYVVLHRSEVVDDDPAPISLHATRIVEDWAGGSTSWAAQPRSIETRLPSTFVEPGRLAIVRLDVRDLVRQWARRDPQDQGIAIVADRETRSGTTFALRRVGAGALSSSEGLDVEPYLELYLR